MGLLKSFSTGAAVLVLSAGVVTAATVDIGVMFIGDGNGTAAINANRTAGIAARDAFIGNPLLIVAQEDFEGFTACDGSNGGSCSASAGATPLNTAVGDFFSLGTLSGSGSTAVAPKGEVVVKERPSTSPNGGRYSVNSLDGNGKWLDSNDNKGIAWDIPGSAGFRFNKLAFFLTDLNDAGSLKFRISADGTVLDEKEVAYIGSGASADDLNNAALHLVTMSFSQVVGGTENIRIELLNTTVNRNDGFGIDGIVAAIPLPAAGWLLLAAFGGLGVAARRKRKIAA